MPAAIPAKEDEKGELGHLQKGTGLDMDMLAERLEKLPNEVSVSKEYKTDESESYNYDYPDSSCSGSMFQAGIELENFLIANGIEFELGSSIEGAAVVADMTLPGEPLVYINESFCQMTGYPREEIIGKNCKFLQGKDTKEEDVERIRTIVKSRKEGAIALLNYDKCGVPFHNVLYIMPLFTQNGTLRFFAGFQTRPHIIRGGDTADSSAEAGRASVSMIQLPSNLSILGASLRRGSGDAIGMTPNGEPIPVVTQYFKGALVFQTLIKQTQAKFKNRKERYNINVTGQMLQTLDGNLWVGLEAIQPLPTGKVRSAVARMLFTVTRVMSKAEVYASLKQTKDMGAIVARKITSDQITEGQTIKLSITDQFLDFEKWKIRNLPGVQSKGFTYFIGDQQVRLVMYATQAKGRHHDSPRVIVASVDLHSKFLPWSLRG